MSDQPQQESTYKKTNLWMISTLVLVGAIVGFGIAQFPNFSGDSSSGRAATLPSEQQKQPSEKDYAKLSEALLDDDTVFGDLDAPVTVIEFSDFQCPFCAASAGIKNSVYENLQGRDSSWQPAIPRLFETYIKDGKVKFVYRDFPLSGHPQAQITAEAGECADEQGKFIEMHDEIFKGVADWSGDTTRARKLLKDYAASLGLNTAQFNECLDSGKYTAEVQKDLEDGVRAGVSGTPTFFINGRTVSGAQSFDVIADLIDSLL